MNEREIALREARGLLLSRMGGGGLAGPVWEKQCSILRYLSTAIYAIEEAELAELDAADGYKPEYDPRDRAEWHQDEAIAGRSR